MRPDDDVKRALLNQYNKDREKNLQWINEMLKEPHDCHLLHDHFKPIKRKAKVKGKK